MCFFFPLKSHKVQGRCAQVDRVSYTILQNVERESYSALDSKPREKRGIKCLYSAKKCLA